MLKLLRRKSFRKSKEFKPGASRNTLNSSSGSVSNSAGTTGGHYYLTRPQRRVKNNPETLNSQNSLDRKSIGSHRYSSANLGSTAPAPELVQYSRPPENLQSPVRESSLEEKPPPAPTGAKRRIMNVISAHPAGEDTATRLRTGNVMPTPRCLPPTPKRSTSGHGHHHYSRGEGTSLPPTAQALPIGAHGSSSASHEGRDPILPKPSARMSLRAKVFSF